MSVVVGCSGRYLDMECIEVFLDDQPEMFCTMHAARFGSFIPPSKLSPLELAAVAYVAARRDFDSVPFMVRQRYKYGPWKTYAKAWCRLEAAAKDAEKATSE